MFPIIGSTRAIFKGMITMPNFETYVARLGEFGVQALVERLERYEGIRAQIGISLEERWSALMQAAPAPAYSLAT
jgi:hypothetical protein